MKAFLKNYRQSPRKVRLVTDLIKGKRVSEAFVELDVLPRRASLPVKNLIKSAVANAKSMGIEAENLVVGSITVNKGIVLKRIMPRARGSASRINKRTSHITLTLIDKADTKAKKKVVEKEEKVVKKVKKPATKKAVKADK